MGRSRRVRGKRSLAALFVAVLLAAIVRLAGVESFSIPQSPPSGAATGLPTGSKVRFDPDAGARRVARALAERESGFMVTVEGEVSKVLADDSDGSRHQRFLVRVGDSRQTILVAHNIDLAERAPVTPGVRIRLRGQYEWNERGGVLHWTHRDPDGSHPGGFVEIAGRRIE